MLFFRLRKKWNQEKVWEIARFLGIFGKNTPSDILGGYQELVFIPNTS